MKHIMCITFSYYRIKKLTRESKLECVLLINVNEDGEVTLMINDDKGRS